MPGQDGTAPDILPRSSIFVECPPQIRVEGESRQLDADHPVTEPWQVIAEAAKDRTDPRQITLFGSVDFAIEDFPALRYIHDRLQTLPFSESLDMIADPDDPRGLYGMLVRAKANAT